MKNLNKGWLALIASGIFFLLAFIAMNVMESISGGGEEFFFTIQQFPTNTLLIDATKNHLENGSFEGSEDSFIDNQTE